MHPSETDPSVNTVEAQLTVEAEFTNDTSAALQQKRDAYGREIETLSNADLHQETSTAYKALRKRCAANRDYMVTKMIPLCREIIARYKMQGVADRNRPNGRPTVEAYFASINLKYSTVRCWFSRYDQSPQFDLFPKNLHRDHSIDVHANPQEASDAIFHEIHKAFARFVSVCDSFQYRCGIEFNFATELRALWGAIEEQIEAATIGRSQKVSDSSEGPKRMSSSGVSVPGDRVIDFCPMSSEVRSASASA